MEPIMATVSQLNAYMKRVVDGQTALNDIWIKGEISNFKDHYSGHLYITLKDEGGVLKAVMFKSAAVHLTFRPEALWQRLRKRSLTRKRKRDKNTPKCWKRFWNQSVDLKICKSSGQVNICPF